MKDIVIPAEMVGFLKYVRAPAVGVRVSPIVAGSFLWTARDGRIVNIISKMQFFYDEEGNTSYLMGSVSSFNYVNISEEGKFELIDDAEQTQSSNNRHVSNYNHNQQIHTNRNANNNYYDSSGMDVSF